VTRAFQPDVVHAHWWFPGGLAALLAKTLTGTRVVTTLHGSDLKLAAQPGLGRMLARYVLSRSAAVTTVSKFLARGVTQAVPAARPMVAPMPVVADLFHAGGERERHRLLFVGKLNEQKGISHLIRALGIMKQRATLDVVVGVGSDERAARSLAASVGVADRIRWFPLLSQAQLAEVYRRVTALVVPSVEEGLGLVAVEAHLSETPVVAFDSGGLPDVVVPGTGLLVKPGRPDLLAAALDELLARPDHGAAMGAAGRAHALATFTPAAVAARYQEVYGAALR
jgi:glycosyltransferase involved in cell wall biosynthesis